MSRPVPSLRGGIIRTRSFKQQLSTQPPSLHHNHLPQCRTDRPVQHQVGDLIQPGRLQIKDHQPRRRCAWRVPGIRPPGKPPATSRSEMNRSASSVSRSARRISSTGIDWPNEIVADLHPATAGAMRHDPVLLEIHPQRARSRSACRNPGSARRSCCRATRSPWRPECPES